MSPHEFDGVRILVVDGELGTPGVSVLARGTGEFDGKQFQIVGDDGEAFEFPEHEWGRVAVPVSGKWKKQFPESDFYFVIPA